MEGRLVLKPSTDPDFDAKLGAWYQRLLDKARTQRTEAANAK